MSIQIHTATREESNNRAMLAPESKTKSGIVLRGISLGSLEILRQLANPLSTAEADLSAVDTRVWAEFLCMHGTYSLTGGRAVSYTAESSMAYRVLMGRRHPFLLLEGRTGERCAHEAPRRGIRKDGTWYTYGWDLTKNICESARRPPKGRLREQAVRAIGQTRSVCPAGARSREAAPSQVFSSGGTILTAYTYTPYGAVTANGNVTQPIQWSSEYNDSELGLVYYNYRHYNPADGRWTGRDPFNGDRFHVDNRYHTCKNATTHQIDVYGLELFSPDDSVRSRLPKEAYVEVNKVNCIGYATGLNVGLHPSPGTSLEALFSSLGWECEDMKNGQCSCSCKTEQVMVVYVYIMRLENIIGSPVSRDNELLYFREIQKRIKENSLDVWGDSWAYVSTYSNNLTLLDYHGLKRNCNKKEGSSMAWSYVPANLPRGNQNLKVHYLNHSAYFSQRDQVVVSKCCRKRCKQ